MYLKCLYFCAVHLAWAKSTVTYQLQSEALPTCLIGRTWLISRWQIRFLVLFCLLVDEWLLVLQIELDDARDHWTAQLHRGRFDDWCFDRDEAESKQWHHSRVETRTYTQHIVSKVIDGLGEQMCCARSARLGLPWSNWDRSPATTPIR